MGAQATCHVVGPKKASRPSTNWPKKFTLTARRMVRNSTRHSRKAWSKKWPAPKKTGKRKRNYIDTYNDLNEGELIIKDEECSDEEQWVTNNVFTV
jgi:hypothetical protein